MLARLFADPIFVLTLGGSAILLMGAIQEREQRWFRAFLAFLLTSDFICNGLANRAVTLATPHTLDALFCKLDGGFSTQIYTWARQHALVRWLSAFTYSAIGLFLGFILCVSPDRKRMMCALLLVSLPAPFLYYLFPAVGPAHVGDVLAARNCMPSMHLTWAILMARYAHPRVRFGAWVFAAATAFATLATGEHYWIDLIAAVVYSLAGMVATRAATPSLLRLFATFSTLGVRRTGVVPQAVVSTR